MSSNGTAAPRGRKLTVTVIALIVAGGGLALAGSALLPGESRQGSGGAPIVGPTPSGVFPSVIPDETPGGPKNLFAEHYPDPTLPGQEIEFAVDWKNSDGVAVHALICKTPKVNEGRCSEGAWAYGGMTRIRPSLAHLTVSLAHLGSNPYYAFVCDERGDCSAGRSGVFRVQQPPTILSAEDQPDPVRLGETVKFRIERSDPDLPSGDHVQGWLCLEDGIAVGGCPDAYWGASEFSNTGVSKISDRASKWNLLDDYEFDPCDRTGTCVYHYYAFVCDRGGACGGSIHGTFTVLRGRG